MKRYKIHEKINMKLIAIGDNKQDNYDVYHGMGMAFTLKSEFRKKMIEY